jgi:hypothetical protein
MVRYIAGIIGILAMVVGVFIYVSIQEKVSKAQESRPATGEEASDTVARLEERLERLNEKLERLSMQSRTNPLARAVDNSFSGQGRLQKQDDPKGPMSGRLDLPGNIQEQNRQVQERFEMLSRGYARETRDPIWAEDAESHLRIMQKSLEAAGMMNDAELKSECKANICKVEGSYKNAEAQKKVSDTLRSQFFSSGEVRRFEENGELHSTTFLYRQGFPMPK